MANRDQSLDIIRGGAVLWVVLMHADAILGTTPVLQELNTYGGAVRMPVLMLVSGMLVSHRVGDRDYLRRRTAHFGWVLVVWTAIHYLALRLLVGDAIIASELAHWLGQPQTALWFIWALGLATLCLLILPRAWALPIVALLVAVSTASHWELLPLKGIAAENTCKHLAFFFVGAYAAPVIRSLVQVDPKHIPATLAAVLAMGAADLILREKGAVEVFAFVSRLAAVLLILQLAPHVAKIELFARPMAWFGRNTLAIFVVHEVVLMAISVALAATQVGLLTVILATVGAVGCSLAFKQMIDIYGPRWLFQSPSILGGSPPQALRVKS